MKTQKKKDKGDKINRQEENEADQIIEFITKKQDLLYQKAYSITKNKEQAKDLQQETILKIIKNINKYKKGTNIEAWSYTIMYNTYKNEIKRQACEDKYKQHILQQTQNTFTYDYELYGNKMLIREIIDKMPQNFAMPIKMFLNGYKYNEIAKSMKIPMTTVRNRIHILKNEIRKEVERENRREANIGR